MYIKYNIPLIYSFITVFVLINLIYFVGKFFFKKAYPKPTSVFGLMFHFISKRPTMYFSLCILKCIAICYGLFASRMTSNMIALINHAWEKDKMHLLFDAKHGLFLLLCMTAGSVFFSLIEIISGMIRGRLKPWFAKSVREYYFDYVIEHSFIYFNQNPRGSILARIIDIVSSTIIFTDVMISSIIPCFFFLFIGLLIFINIDKLFALFYMIWCIVQILVTIIRCKEGQRLSQNNSKHYRKLTSEIADIFDNIFSIKNCRSEDFEKLYFRTFNKNDIDSYRDQLLYSERSSGILTTVYHLFFSLIFIYCLFRALIKGQITPAKFIEINSIAKFLGNQVYYSTDKIGDLIYQYQRANESLTDIVRPQGVPDLYPNVHISNSGPETGSIVFSNVSFCYNTDMDTIGYNSELEVDSSSYVIKNLNLRIEPNSKVAFVGYSGSGKSTIVQLLMKFFNIINGKIVVNGNDISKVSQESLRNLIAFVPQSEVFFHRPMFINIAYGCKILREKIKKLTMWKKDIKFSHLDLEDRARIIDAAEVAFINDVIENSSRGYDSIFGQDIGLSGGQKQRCSIARAAIKRSYAQFLILDEATSALDAGTESSISDSIEILSKNMTTITIAHRLHTVKKCRIIVFDKGRIVEDGKHYDLIGNNGIYAKLWNNIKFSNF